MSNDGKASLNETPSGNRIRISFFGLRNAGKSTLVNAFTGQQVAIVSDVAGTTTDPVSKAMEILPLGPCLITDTAGLDDTGALGEQRVRKSLDVLAETDIAVWVSCADGEAGAQERKAHERFAAECSARSVAVFEYKRGDSVEELKKSISTAKMADAMPGLLDGLVSAGNRVVCVCPIDESAPKGRLILPQQQVIRECLDRRAWCVVCQPDELGDVLKRTECDIVVTDSQAFGAVRDAIQRFTDGGGKAPRLTSFSILFARQKGDLSEYARGLAAFRSLRDGDTVLVAEGCTHHRQCNDIGTVKIPKALKKLSGRELTVRTCSGGDFPLLGADKAKPALVVHCGGCMLTRREMQRRIGAAKSMGVPIVNYGMVLAAANGVPIGDVST